MPQSLAEEKRRGQAAGRSDNCYRVIAGHYLLTAQMSKEVSETPPGRNQQCLPYPSLVGHEEIFASAMSFQPRHFDGRGV